MLNRVLFSFGVFTLFIAPSFSNAQGPTELYRFDPFDGAQYVNQDFPDFPEFSTVFVNDVVVPAEGWCINSVTTYVTNLRELSNETPPFWHEGLITQGVLNIIPDADLAATDPVLEGLPVVIAIATTDIGNNVLEVTTSGLNLECPPGTNWVGLTAVAEFATFGQEFTWGIGDGVLDGAASQGRNPGGGFGVGTEWFVVGTTFGKFDWDMALLITGSLGECTGGGTFCPTAFNTFRGILIAGDLDSLCGVDGDTVIYNPGITINDSEASIWPEVFGNVGAGPGPSTSISITSQAGTPGLTYTVEHRNYTTGQRDVIGTKIESFNVNQTVTWPLSSDHVDSNGDVESRIGWRRTGLTINYPHEVRIDDISWIVQ